MRAALCLALMGFLAFSGCTDSNPDPATDGGAATGDDATDSGVSGEGSEAAGAGATTSEPLRLEGRTPIGGCFGAGGVFGQCQNLMGEENFARLDGEPQHLGGTLTWDNTMQTGAMFAVLLVCDADATNCSNDGSQPTATGGSPLVIDWDLSGLSGETLSIWIVQYTGQGTAAAYALAETPLDFVFDGVLTSIEA